MSHANNIDQSINEQSHYYSYPLIYKMFVIIKQLKQSGSEKIKWFYNYGDFIQ